MHIAYVAPAWPPAGAANGIVTYVAAMRRALVEAGHEVSVLAGGWLHAADGRSHALDDAASGGALIDRLRHRLGCERGDQPSAAAMLARRLARARAIARFDLVEMEESFGWARAARRAVDVPVVVRLHGPEFMRPLEPGMRGRDRRARQRMSAEGHAIRTAAAVTAPTVATLDATRAFYRRGLVGSAVIPNPIDACDTAPRWTPRPGNETILFVGRFDHAKGADTVLEAFRLLAIRRPRARLVVVGPDEGLAIAGGVRLSFDAYAARFLNDDLRARVRFTGKLDAEAIARLRVETAITVVASRAETFSYAAVEAMAAGSPLVVGGWPGSAEIVADGVDGWIVPSGDPRALERRLDWLLDRPDIAARAGALARHRSREAFSPAAVGRRSLDMYRQTLARHGRG